MHRDIKSGNVMLTAKDQVKILDFGLAQIAGRSKLTKTGTTLGTPAYMSPEQAQGLKTDRRADIWSFGVVLYEMLTGRLPFKGDHEQVVIYDIINEQPEPVTALRTGLPTELDRILNKALAKDPGERYQHVEEMIVDLRSLAKGDEQRTGSPAAPQTFHRSWKRFTWGGAAAAAAILGAVLTWLTVRPNETIPPAAGALGDFENWRVVPFTSYPGSEVSPSFSPDGNHIVFAWNGESRTNYDIYVKKVGSEKPVPLTSTPGDEFAPAWSPDGRNIAFVRYDEGGKGSLNLMPSTGGSERVLGQVTTRRYEPPFASHLSWTTGGKGIIFSDKTEVERPAQLFHISIETGERRQLTEGSRLGHDGDSHPALSPGGETLAFVRDLGSFVSDIYTLSLSNDFEPVGEPRRLGFSENYNFHLSWTADESRILFGKNWHGGIWSMFVMDSDDETSVPLSGEHVDRPVIAPVGHRLAYVRHDFNEDIVRLPIRLSPEDTVSPKPVAPSTHLEIDPRYSPDGKRIAFRSGRSGPNSIWLADADGSNPQLLYDDAGSPRWSPDGKRLVFDKRLADTQNQPQLFVMNVSDRRVVRLTNSQSTDAVASWSRDGRWIYFASNRSGRSETWKVSPGGGEPEQVTKNGGGPATESPDGKTLYFVKENQQRTSLWKVPVAGGEEEFVLEPVLWWNFEPTDKGIYYIEPPGPGAAVRYFDLTTEKSKALWRFPPGWASSFGFSVSPTETDLLFSLGQPDSDIILVENFR